MRLNTVFVLCTPDPASSNVGGQLKKLGGFEKEASAGGKELFASRDAMIVSIDSIHIHREGLDDEIERDFGLRPDRLVFMSTHRSATNTPAITFHPIGNYGEARLGGMPCEAVPSCPELMTGLLLSMQAKEHDGYQVTYEATHHGPHLRTPALFAEIGSDENAWRDEEAGGRLAAVLLSMSESEGVNAIGIGGGHYCSRFKEIAQKRKINFGHFIPNHSLPSIDEKVASMIAERSPGTAHYVIHEDRKNMDGIERVAGLMEAAGLRRLDHQSAELR